MDGWPHAAHLVTCLIAQDTPIAQVFLYQLLRGLNFLHTSGVLHRDLKPKNSESMQPQSKPVGHTEQLGLGHANTKSN